MGSKCITPIAEGGFLNFKCNQSRSHVKNVGHSKVLGRHLGEGALSTSILLTLEPYANKGQVLFGLLEERSRIKSKDPNFAHRIYVKSKLADFEDL